MRRAWGVAFALALAGVTWLLLAPSGPQAPGPEQGGDKLAHVVLFALLGLLAATAFPGTPRAALVAGLVAYGIAIELVQGGVGRHQDAADVLADLVGASVAWLVPRAPRRGGR